MNYVFGSFELDARGFKLRREGVEVPLQPKVFDAIRYLVENHDRVVRKEELLEALWPGEHVNDTAVPWTISRARKALGQEPEAKDPIETVRGRGYRFTAEVVQQPSCPPGPASSKILKAPSERASGALLAGLGGNPFVGRAEAMERLMGALHSARTGRGRLCLVTGEAGMGKTRLLGEFSAAARGMQLQVSSGRCLEGGRTAAFWPWVQVLRDMLGQESVPSEAKNEARALLAELVPRTDTFDRSQALDDAAGFGARFWVLEKLSRHLLTSGELGPRLILLEDVHWADDASLDLLAFLSAELAHVGVLVVATARETLPSGSDAWAKVLPRLGPCERIELSALPPRDVEAYVNEVTGFELPTEIHQTVFAKCAGNPLFLQESVRLLAATCSSRGVGALRTDDIKVPNVARDVLRARLTGLSVEASAVLEIACVIGQEFELPVVQAALVAGAAPGGHDGASLLASLDEASRARLVIARSSRSTSFAFVHETIREALYEELSAARRAELHCRVAEAIEARSAGNLRTNDLAYHYYRGLPRAEAARVQRHARRAGEHAMKRFAYEEAARFFGWAIEAESFESSADPRSGCELLLAQGDALRLSGRVSESRVTLGRAIDVARAHRFPDLLLHAARLLRPTVRSALVPDRQALQALEDAQKLTPDDARGTRIRVLAQLACIPPYSLSMGKSHELSQRAVELARAQGDARLLAQALTSRLHVLSGPDHIEETLAVTTEILRLDPERAAETESNRYVAFLHLGDAQRAEAALEGFGRIVRAEKRAEAVWHYGRMKALRDLHMGEYAQADASFHELLAQARRMRLPYANMQAAFHACAMAFERMGLVTIPANGLAAHVEWAVEIPAFNAHWVRFLVETGNRDEARDNLDSMAVNGFSGVTKEVGYLNALAHLAASVTELGEVEHAEALYALLRPYPHHNTPNGFQYCMGSVSHFLGLLAGLLGRTREAIGHFEDALATNGRMGYRPQVARTQAALARLLSESARVVNRTRAASLVVEAGAAARRFEMAQLQAQVERIAARLGGGSDARVAPQSARARG